jgi:hypothetical protein
MSSPDRISVDPAIRFGRWMAGVLLAAGAALAAAGPTHEFVIRAQSPTSAGPPSGRLPDEATGIAGIAQALISVFDHADIVALGESHGRFTLDSDLQIAMVRHPDFAKNVRSIVIECGSVTEQLTLDRYVRGETVPRVQLQRVWKATEETTNGFCDAPIYADFLAAVRDTNSKLPAEARIRVLAGHPGPGSKRGIETVAVSVLKEQVLQKHGKALVIYGAAHFYRALPASLLSSMGEDIGLARRLEATYPGRTLVVIPVGRLDPPRGITGDVEPDFQKFDRALKTQVRPVLVPLHRLPFRDFTAEEFLGRTVMTCRGPGGCVSAFKGSTLRLGQMADACIYVGGAGAGKDATPSHRR